MRLTIAITILFLSQAFALNGQKVWPGDINNNGIVNNIDVLYWGFAREYSGDARVEATTDWQEQDLPENLWDLYFPNDLNYAYADCDGDGDVDFDDLDIIHLNFGKDHGTPIKDNYDIGNAKFDPSLSLSTQTPVVFPDDTLRINVSLGAENDSIHDFFGLAFTVEYEPDVVHEGDGNFIFKDYKDAWINGGDERKERVFTFFVHDDETSSAQVAIVRKHQNSVSGAGDIGEISIVIEDIVAQRAKIRNTDILLVDLELESRPIAPSELEFQIDTTATKTSLEDNIRTEGISIYPNPASSSIIQLELADQNEAIRAIQIFDAKGQIIKSDTFSHLGNQYNFNSNDLPVGLYTIKAKTGKHIYITVFSKVKIN